MRHPTAPLSIGLGLAISLLIASFATLPTGHAQARESDRTLKLFFGHTGERGEFTFKRNGRFDRGEIRRLNHFLRDWRKGEDAKMDPQLLDLVWSIYRESGSRDYIHVVSAYRSPATNEMLRSRSSGVAKNSQHRLGKAMDWYVPDVPLAKLRGIAMKMQGGGVGYYPRSGSPFVHTDTGSVRAWPRMTRQQLLALFPNGNTLHLPADGKPLPGYELAVARRKAGGDAPVLAYLDTETSESEATDRTGTKGTASGWLKRVFRGDGQDDADVAEAAPETVPPVPVAPAAAESELAAVEETTIDARTPRARPVVEMAAGTEVASADAEAIAAITGEPIIPRMRPDMQASTSTEAAPQDALAALAGVDNPEFSAAQRLELAFAPVPEAPAPSGADRAILSAFAAIDGSVVREADAELMAAITSRAAGEDLPTAEPLRLAFAFSANEPSNGSAADPATVSVAPRSGIVLGPDGSTDYSQDTDGLLGLIESGEENHDDVQLEMPSPQAELYAQPDASPNAVGLNGVAGPPADRFVRKGGAGTDEEQGFFSRLFASMIE